MNPYTARRIAIDRQEGVDRLKQFPQISLPVLKAADPAKTRDRYVGDYTVRYVIANEVIYILRVWHSYDPLPTVKYFEEILSVVSKDANAYFFG